MSRLLFCHRGALGDFILTLPSLSLLRKNFPEWHFTGLGKPEYLKLAAEFGLCDEIYNCEFADFIPFFENGEIPEALSRINTTILWLNNSNHLEQSLKKQNIKTLIIEPFSDSETHTGKRYFSIVSDFFFRTQAYKIDDFLPETVCNDKSNIALIHPGSGSKKKNFEPEFYKKIYTGLKIKGLNPKFIFGPVELENEEYKNYTEHEKSLLKNCTELKDEILSSRLFIGNDSGPAHLAGFCGITTITIFKSTSIRQWHPLGRKVICFYRPDIEDIMNCI